MCFDSLNLVRCVYVCVCVSVVPGHTLDLRVLDQEPVVFGASCSALELEPVDF